MFGEESVPKLLHGDKIYVSVDNKKAFIDLTQFKVKKTFLFTIREDFPDWTDNFTGEVQFSRSVLFFFPHIK